MEESSVDLPETPSEFYRHRRPEFFSDSERTYEVELPREHFAFELDLVSTNMKQDAFETFCRRLAEKFISPNLIPQVGPTGGGDGKTDSETYPIAESISARWFTPENGWKSGENWAFAFSAKKEWKAKVKGDVKKIVQTGRGYTKAYFITNQLVASKKKKETQDELKALYNLDVIILDREWIIEKVYNNNLINLAVDSLNLSQVYRNEKLEIGKNDATRTKRLAEVEKKISNTNRYFEYDYQLVEDALEAAILARMLERPKDEIIGKFNRSLRFAHKVDSKQHLLRIHYQMAWTYINWYDDYAEFVTTFSEFKKYAEEDINIFSLELYYTLLQLLRAISFNETVKATIGDVNYSKEEELYKNVLDSCETDNSKPSIALVAGTYRSFLNIFHLLLGGQDIVDDLKFLRTQLDKSCLYLEYPFESIRAFIEILGEILPNSKEYDDIIDCIAEISEKRASELAASHTFLKRGFQKLDKKYYKDSLIYFGKSVKKLAKKESQNYLYIALKGLSCAYERLGLHWATNSCHMAIASITFRDWSNEGKPSQRFFECVKEAMKNELFIGRLPYFLGWHELYQIIMPQFEQESLQSGDIQTDILADACLAIRLLNTSDARWKSFTFLPDIFAHQGLSLSQDAALYLLGQTNLIETGHLRAGQTIDDYFNSMANQGFKDQMVFDTDLLDANVVRFQSAILGTSVIIKFKRNKELAIFAEVLLAFLESFLATSFDNVYPSAEVIIVTLEEDNSIEYFDIIEANDSSILTVCLNVSADSNKGYNNKIHELLIGVVAILLTKNFVINNAKEYLRALYEKDELHERQSIIVEHRKFFMNVFGNEPKIFINDWVKDSMKKYEYKRDSNPIKIENSVKQTEVSEKEGAGGSKEDFRGESVFDNPKHNETSVFSIIDNHLWDKAHWTGFGFFATPEIPFGMFLAFEDGEAGRKIFQNWIEKFGSIDQNEDIRISIVKGVNKLNPHWYRVQISKRIDIKDLKDGQRFVTASRFHEMNPQSSENISLIINMFAQFNHYILFPATYKLDRTVEVIQNLDLGILKKRLDIKEAWAIGENDLDSVVILKKDDPVIPVDQPDAPIKALLAKKRQS